MSLAVAEVAEFAEHPLHRNVDMTSVLPLAEGMAVLDSPGERSLFATLRRVSACFWLGVTIRGLALAPGSRSMSRIESTQTPVALTTALAFSEKA